MVVSAFSYFQYREISAFCQVEDCATHLFSQKTTSHGSISAGKRSVDCVFPPNMSWLWKRRRAEWTQLLFNRSFASNLRKIEIVQVLFKLFSEKAV